MKTIALTREEWNAIWDCVKRMRNDGSDINLVADALYEAGLEKPAARIRRRLSGLFGEAEAIVRTLIAAEERGGGSDD